MDFRNCAMQVRASCLCSLHTHFSGLDCSILKKHYVSPFYNIWQGNKRFCIAKPDPDPVKALISNPLATASQAAAAAPLIAPVQHVTALLKFNQCGRLLRGGSVASNTDELKQMLKPIARSGGVVGVMVSPGYDDMLANWLCYIKVWSKCQHVLLKCVPGMVAMLRDRAAPQEFKVEELATEESWNTLNILNTLHTRRASL